MKALSEASGVQGSRTGGSPKNQDRVPRSKGIKENPQEFAGRVLAAAIAKIENSIPNADQIREGTSILRWVDNMDAVYKLQRELQVEKLNTKLQFGEGMKLAAFILGNKKDEIVNAIQAA